MKLPRFLYHFTSKNNLSKIMKEGLRASDVSWDVKLRKDNENDTISGKNINGYYLFSGLESGTYNISVFGKIDNVEKFTGSAKVTIANGNSVSVNVPIVATKNLYAQIPSTGYATITMDMSDELLSKMGQKVFFQAALVDADNNFYIASFVDEENQILLDNQQITFAYTDYNSQIQTTEIPTGYYYLTFSGLEEFGYAIKLKDNLVEIGDGLTTNIVLTENDYEIVENYYSVLYVNKDGGENADGKTLSNPIAFSSLNDDNFSDAEVLYLLSDVEFSNGETTVLSPMFENFTATISSFGSTVRTISANISDYSNSITLGYGTTLKNIKLSGSNAFSFESLNIDETVILDTPIAKNSDSVVNLDKSSKLVIGQKFSGELGICLSFEDWNIGDTVVTFENGVKPSNSNFYISEDADMPTGFASMFYIDDNGKLAQYDAITQWVNFAWDDECPYLITQTQAKNKTYTSIYDNDEYLLGGFNGISTYDEENQTWYFINNSYDSSALYSITNPKNYEGVVEATLIEIGDSPVTLSSITAMDYDDDKLYMGFYDADCLNLCVIETSNGIGYLTSAEFKQVSNLTALLVDGDNVYMATKNPTADNSGITHSAIWQLTLELTENGYILSPAQTYIDDSGAQYPVPYYQTSSDIFDGTTDGSTFRITDLYSDRTSVYGLLANYIEIDARTQNDKVYMRGSVFKLKENTTTVNANHFGLRNSLSISDIQTAKQSFILPRKIVGIVNKKLIIADDGMIPDKTDCNLDRFILFDLDGTLSEIIDVNVPFTTSGTSSVFATGSLF